MEVIVKLKGYGMPLFAMTLQIIVSFSDLFILDLFGSWDLSLGVMLVWTFVVWVPTCVLLCIIQPYIWTSYVRVTLSITWGDIFTSIYYFI